jgi:urease gamma subunit
MAAPTPEQLADEARRARKVRQVVDIATAMITQSNMTVNEAEALVQDVRARILALFPDGAETYELIYAPRFRRLVSEYTRGRHPGVVIPFRRRLA